MRLRRAHLIYGLALALVAATAATALAAPWGPERIVLWLRGTGWCGLGLLAASLVATPLGAALARLPRGPKAGAIGAARRAFGIGAAACAALHLGSALGTVLSRSWGRVLEVPWLRAGAAAALILAALWLTSYPRAVRLLRVRLWKPLHRLAYVAGALALQHALLAPMSAKGWLLAVGGAVLVIAPLRLLGPRRPARLPRRDGPDPSEVTAG